MKKYKKGLTSILAMLVVTLGMQAGFVSGAFAADTPTDLTVSSYITNYGRTLEFHVCNAGPTPVTSVTLDLPYTNYTPTDLSVLTAMGNAQDIGSITDQGIWSGILGGQDPNDINDQQECLKIVFIGNPTTNIGSVITFNPSITSSMLEDSSANIDPNPSNNDGSDGGVQYSVIADPDLALSTRLLTSGTISAGANVSYEITLSNIGSGDYDATSSDNEPGFYFIMPAGANYTSLTDLNTGDNLSLGDIGGNGPCENFGDVQAIGSYFNIDLSKYSGYVMHCAFDLVDNTFASNTSFSFQLNMSASDSFASGDTEVVGVAVGNDGDTGKFFFAEFTGKDFFAVPINNIMHLTYDASALVPTFTPCAGQGEVTTVDDACFDISFNKEIYGPSFTSDKVIVTGGGHVSSFAQNSSNSWTVHVTGMTLGGTTTLTIDPSTVEDLSAVQNGTQVLGINTIRFAAVTASTDGSGNTGTVNSAGITTLPKTGKNIDLLTPLMLLIFGLGIAKFMARKKELITI